MSEARPLAEGPGSDEMLLQQFLERIPPIVDDRPYLVWADRNRARVAIREQGSPWLIAEDKLPFGVFARWFLDASTDTYAYQEIPVADTGECLVDLVTAARCVVFKNAEEFQKEFGEANERIRRFFLEFVAQPPPDWYKITPQLLNDLGIRY